MLYVYYTASCLFAAMIKIEVWSDISCPFCWLGKARLDNAIKTTKVNAEVILRSFQLNPSVSLYDYLHSTKGYPPDQIRQINDRLSAAGSASGLEFNFEKIVVANTMKAHMLLHYARSFGKLLPVADDLFRAYFMYGKNVDDPAVLQKIAGQNGLDENEFLNVINDLRYNQDILSDISEASALNVRGVPFFVFNRKFAVSGAQEQSVFEQTLMKCSA
jgi:predicted DsbA family dithiol-disulfide isomerase